MLSEQEKKEIAEELEHLPRKTAGGLEALRVVQKYRSWISDEAVSDISEYLGMSETQIDGLASFYNLIYRKPVGRHVILFCDSISCWIKNADNLQEQLGKHLGIKPGETTSDDRFTLIPVACLGACDKAPVMMIDDDLHVNLTEEKIKEILEQYK
ncbi:MAG: NADH-quinone oxidoreductase subunit NuoE [Bacteroidales bacterium]|nr:NADH-quinone oxidoreductase subunit NuoE [Bacteroidales bacterium]